MSTMTDVDADSDVRVLRDRQEPADRRLTAFPNVVNYVLLSVSVVVAIALWHLIVTKRHVSPLVIPTPGAVAHALRVGFERGLYIHETRVTLTECSLGFALGASLGIVLGAIFAEFKLLPIEVLPYMVFFEALPKIAVGPLFVIWFGFGITSKVILVAFVCFFVVLISSLKGFEATDAEQLELMQVLRASRWETFRRVRIYNALPSIMGGLQVAVLLSLLGAIVAEFVGAPEGLGVLLLTQQQALDLAGMFATLLLLAFLGLVLNTVVRVLDLIVTRRWT